MKWMFSLALMILFAGCFSTDPDERSNEEGAGIKLSVHNPLDQPIEDAVIEIDNWHDITKNQNSLALGALFAESNGVFLDIEPVDFDRDNKTDRVLLTLDLGAHEMKSVSITNNGGENPHQTVKRTHSELSIKEGGMWKDRVYQGGDFRHVKSLSVPPEHTDHSFYIRYEGPGWESEKVGYRFYLDWRNATDIFGKVKDGLVLENVGMDGFDSYHEMSEWGMDILKVGDALGIGALGCWSQNNVLRMSQTDSVNCIVQDGLLCSSVETMYYGWTTPYGKSDVRSTLSILAGDRMTKHEVHLEPQIDSICTGIVKHAGVEVLRSDNTENWSYLATWGKQSLAEDNLGMVVFYKTRDQVEVTEDPLNYVVVLKPSDNGTLSYFFAACWEQEENGLKTKEDFHEYLELGIARLSHPVEWKIEN